MGWRFTDAHIFIGTRFRIPKWFYIHGSVEVPDPLSGDNPTYPLIPQSVPAIGVPFFDARFGTILTRVTQIDQAPNVAIHEYSRFDPFNKDQSMVILLPEYDWRVYRTQTFRYNQEANLVTVLHAIAEPRWDPNDCTGYLFMSQKLDQIG